jgi:hypothetical protein
MRIQTNSNYYMIVLPANEASQRIAMRSRAFGRILLNCIKENRTGNGFTADLFKYDKRGSVWATDVECDATRERVEEFGIQEIYEAGVEFDAFEQLSKLELEAGL